MTKKTIEDAVRTLLVARESGTGSQAQILLGHLFHTIVKGFEGVPLPDFGDVMDLYLDPPDEGVQVFQSKGMKAVHIEHDDHGVLLSLGSARKLDRAGDNAFVDALIEVIETGEYDRLATTSISRLCRNTRVAGSLEHALATHKVVVLAAGHEIRVWDEMGKLMWMLLCWFAALEAGQIEARMIAGKLARADKGEWTFGYAPPPGWALTTDGKLRVDPDVADAMRWVKDEVLAGKTNMRELAHGVLKRWPSMPARRGGGVMSDPDRLAGHIRSSWLNPGWFGAYSEEVHEGRFISHAAKQELADKGEEDEAADLHIPTYRFQLPPQPKPIATPEEVERLQARLAELDSARPGQRRRGATFGTSLSWDAQDVVVEAGEAA